MSGFEQMYTLFVVRVLQVFEKFKQFLQLAVQNERIWLMTVDLLYVNALIRSHLQGSMSSDT